MVSLLIPDAMKSINFSPNTPPLFMIDPGRVKLSVFSLWRSHLTEQWGIDAALRREKSAEVRRT